jgi:hypothetical protein
MLSTRKGRRKLSPPPNLSRWFSHPMPGAYSVEMGASLTIGIRAGLFLTHFRNGLPVSTSPENATGGVKFRLTLFLQPNHGFGESFYVPRPNGPHHFLIKRSAGTGPTARQSPRSGPRFRPGTQPRLDVAQPRQIGLAGFLARSLSRFLVSFLARFSVSFLAQGRFRVLQFPK